MKNFTNLPEEKQKTIIEAAFKAFGKNGYRKTSTNDISDAAGISKSMIFHYFGTKRALYFYLIHFGNDVVTKEIERTYGNMTTDFFDRIKLVNGIKMKILGKYPSSTAFFTSVYFEEDKEVKDEIQDILKTNAGLANKLLYEGTDYSKFKEGADLKLLMKLLTWIGDGYAKEFSVSDQIDIEQVSNEFNTCLDMLRQSFYK